MLTHFPRLVGPVFVKLLYSYILCRVHLYTSGCCKGSHDFSTCKKFASLMQSEYILELICRVPLCITKLCILLKFLYILVPTYVTGSAKIRQNRTSLNLQCKLLITMSKILAYLKKNCNQSFFTDFVSVRSKEE